MRIDKTLKKKKKNAQLQSDKLAAGRFQWLKKQ
jgi:hypothetical protein